jgi:hypothetical protein
MILFSEINLKMITLDQLVPTHHLVHKKGRQTLISLSFMTCERYMFSEVGRASISRIILIKRTFIQYTFGSRTMRKTIEEVKTNMAYQWFLGYDFHDKVPQSSTFWKNYERRYKDIDLLNRFFFIAFL